MVVRRFDISLLSITSHTHTVLPAHSMTAVTRSCPVSAHVSFLRSVSLVIRDIAFSSAVRSLIDLPVARPTADMPLPGCRLTGKALRTCVSTYVPLATIVGLQRVRSVTPVCVGPLVGVCDACGHRYALHAMPTAGSSSCPCTSHMRLCFLVGCLTPDEVDSKRVNAPDGVQFTVVSLGDIIGSFRTITLLLRAFGLPQSGSALACAVRLGRALHPQCTDDIHRGSPLQRKFDCVSQGTNTVLAVDVKLCTDGAVVLSEGRQVTTTSFVVLSDIATAQHTDEHHPIVRLAMRLALISAHS